MVSIWLKEVGKSLEAGNPYESTRLSFVKTTEGAKGKTLPLSFHDSMLLWNHELVPTLG